MTSNKYAPVLTVPAWTVMEDMYFDRPVVLIRVEEGAVLRNCIFTDIRPDGMGAFLEGGKYSLAENCHFELNRDHYTLESWPTRN